MLMTREKNKSLNELKQKYSKCAECRNCMTDAKVFGAGNLDADICIIGEGPGQEEYATGLPFVGASGKLLNNILASADIKRENIYITNTVLCRTSTKNRSPDYVEILHCRKRLHEELSIVKPKFTLILGSSALHAVTGNPALRITKVHGQWFTLLERPCYFYFPTMHPSWILHSVTKGEERDRKLNAWKDILYFKHFIDSMGDCPLFENNQTAKSDS